MRKGPPLPSADDMITADDFDAIEVVIEKLGKLIIEKEELQDLREEMSDYKEDVEQLVEVADRAEDLKIQVRESKGARRLFNKLNNMVSKLEKRVSTVDEEETKTKQLVATEELMESIRVLTDVKDPEKLARIASIFSKLDDDSDGKIELDDLVKVLDVIGREHVDMSSKQLEEIIGLLAKEESREEKKAEALMKAK